MKPEITRTFYNNLIYPATIVVEDGKPSLVELARVNVLTKAPLNEFKALKHVKDEYPEISNLSVVKVTTTEEIRGMSIETFVENSVVCERPGSQKKENK